MELGRVTGEVPFFMVAHTNGDRTMSRANIAPLKVVGEFLADIFVLHVLARHHEAVSDLLDS